MFRRILFILLFCRAAFDAFGNEKADALRKTIYQAPDTLRAVILTNIAKVFQYDNLDSCILYAQKASDIAWKTRQYAALIDAKTLLSSIALEKKKYVEATDHQKTILEMTLRLRDWNKAMDAYNAIAQTWLLRNNYAEAVEYLKKGVEIARDQNNHKLSKNFYQALIDSYRKLHNIEAVCTYYQKLMEVNLIIDAEPYNNRINVLQTEREQLINEVANVRNLWLQRSTISKVFHTFVLIMAILSCGALIFAHFWYRFKINPTMIELRRKLYDKENELDTLMKEQEKTFHFLTNQVYTQINLLSRNIEYFKAQYGNYPVAADSPLNRIVNDIYALYGFFQNIILLLQAQSGQLNLEPVTVNIPQLVNDVLSSYEEFAVAKDIRLINEVQNNTFAIADERLIDTVLRNLISNAFKYVLAKSGQITVGTKIGTKVEAEDGISENTEFIEIWVIDDGIGLTPEQADLLFNLKDNLSLPEGDDIKGFGLGLPVCKAIIKAMKGRIWVETKPNEGFCIRFNLPRAKDGEVKTLQLLEVNQQIILTEEDNPLLLLE